jgi:hypothetical protein
MWFFRVGSDDQVVGYGMLYWYPTSFTSDSGIQQNLGHMVDVP